MSDLERYMNELCARAVAVWGTHDQLRQLQEECGELVAAVNHFERGRIDELQLADEIADVIIMCTQACSIVGLKHVRDAMWRKLKRLSGRIEAGEAAAAERMARSVEPQA